MKIHRVGLSLMILGAMGVIVSYLDPRADVFLPAIFMAIGCGIYISF